MGTREPEDLEQLFEDAESAMDDGDYELVLQVLDDTSGRSVEHAERFRLESPAP